MFGRSADARVLLGCIVSSFRRRFLLACLTTSRCLPVLPLVIQMALALSRRPFPGSRWRRSRNGFIRNGFGGCCGGLGNDPVARNRNCRRARYQSCRRRRRHSYDLGPAPRLQSWHDTIQMDRCSASARVANISAFASSNWATQPFVSSAKNKHILTSSTSSRNSCYMPAA